MLVLLFIDVEPNQLFNEFKYRNMVAGVLT